MFGHGEQVEIDVDGIFVKGKVVGRTPAFVKVEIDRNNEEKKRKPEKIRLVAVSD